MTIKAQTGAKLKDALNTAILIRQEGKPLEALRFMESVRDLFDDPEQLRRFHNGLGITYFDLSEFEKAIEEYETALMISGDEMESSAIQVNIANALLALGRTDEARAFLSHAEAALRTGLDDGFLAHALDTKARVYLREGNYVEARRAAKEAFDLHWHGFDSKALDQSWETLSLCMGKI